MNVTPECLKIEKELVEHLHTKGAITPEVYNMLVGSKTDGREDETWNNFLAMHGTGLPKRKSKGSKKVARPPPEVPLVKDSAPLEHIVDNSMPPPPIVDDSMPPEPMKTNEVPKPEPEPTEAWDIVPSPPDQAPKEECVETKGTEDETEREQESKEDKQVDAAGWAFTWCFRCKREDVTKFGCKALPAWLVSTLNFKGNTGEPIVLPICCMGCNNKHRASSVSIAEEEKRLKQAFETLQIHIDGIGEESLRVAKARVGRTVCMIQWGGQAGSVDVDTIKKNLTPEDIVISINLEAYREGKEGADLELEGLAGGLF